MFQKKYGNNMKYLESYSEHSKGVTPEFIEIGYDMDDILAEIVDDGYPYLYKAMYNDKLYGVGGLMIEIASNPDNKIKNVEGNVWVEGYDYFIVTSDMIDVLERSKEYIKQLNMKSDKKYNIKIKGYDGFLGRDVEYDDFLNNKLSFIGITIT